MTTLHIDKLRRGRGTGDEYKVVELDPLPAWGGADSLSIVGQRLNRVEGREKVTGSARYSYDMRLPGQLFARVLRSPLPHAVIKRIDISKAEALPGVHAVMCVENAPTIAWYRDSFVFDRTLRFAGEEVAAVAAESEQIADDALRLIEVEYESLPFVTDFREALKLEAPKLRPSGNLVDDPKVYKRGDIRVGLDAADVVIDRVYTTQVAHHNCLEPHGCTADWEGDRLTLWDSTQSVFDVRKKVAESLEIPEHHVRVVKQFMGGGFGSKQIAWKHDVIAALLSKRTGRPVQLMLDREAENLAVGNRNPTRQHVWLGAKRDGTLTAIVAEIEQGAGAHMAGGEGSDTGGMYQTLYSCPNVRTEQRVIYTNTGPAVAFRAPGHVESAFALESAMDELAQELNLDPVNLRLRNYAEENQLEEKPYTSPESLRQCYQRATERFGWAEYQRTSSTGPKRRGIGFAAHDWGGSGFPPGYAWVKINSDGTADVITGTQDIGTGTRTGLSQIAAEELGFAFESVALHLGDTANGPYAPVSSGSATQATIGPAIRAAAADAKKQLLEAASTYLEAPANRLRVRDGKISIEGELDQHPVPVSDVTAAIAPHMIQGRGARGPNPEGKSIRTFGAQCVEVEVDIETGEVTVLRVVASHDCGRIINPTMVDAQIMGAVVQGIGYTLTEDRVVDNKIGLVLNPNLEDYKVPTVADVPPTTHAAVNLPDLEANPTGAKGIGEPPLVPTAPAIANAVFDAIGVRSYELPLSRSRVLSLLDQRGGESA